MENDSEIPGYLLDEALDTFRLEEGVSGVEYFKTLSSQPGLPKESLALLGICAAFESHPALSPAQLEQATHWLEVALTSGWLDVAASHEATSFLVQVFVWRALAFSDRRRQLLDQIQLKSPEPAGMQWALAEANLECGKVTSDALEHLKALSAEACPPLSTEIVQVWRTWLLVEYIWWLDGDVLSLLPGLAEAIHHAENQLEEPLLRAEMRRLKHRAALLQARIAVAQRNEENASLWLTTASQYQSNQWETHYVAGMLAWLSGDRKQARRDLENSLVDNPLQRRVRFEFDLLVNSLDATLPVPELPGVHDALAGTATCLFRAGRLDEARQRLESLDQPEEPFSLRLIWPHARQVRLQQAWQLRAHLSEAARDWEKALKFWQIARHFPPGLSEAYLEDEQRAHHLFLLGHTLESTRKSPEDLARREAYVQFQSELSLLSASPRKSHTALFYTSLAAPDDRAADWQKLLQDREWTEASRQQSPQNLLCAGDRLWQAGQLQEARKAYIKGRCSTSAPDRWLYATLAWMVSPTPDAMLDVLARSGEQSTPSGHRELLRALCMLAQQPAHITEARQTLEQISQEELSSTLKESIQLLLASFQEGSPEQAIVTDAGKPHWLAMLYAGMDLFLSPRGLQALNIFRSYYGPDWRAWCPIDLVQWFGRELQAAFKRQDVKAAETLISSAEEMGIQLPASWKTRVDMLSALAQVRQNEFSAAQQYYVAALSSLPPDGVKEKNDE